MNNVQLSFEYGGDDDFTMEPFGESRRLRPRYLSHVEISLPATVVRSDYDAYADDSHTVLSVQPHIFKEYVRDMSEVGRRAWEGHVSDLTRRNATLIESNESYRNSEQLAWDVAHAKVEQARRWKQKYMELRDRTRRV